MKTCSQYTENLTVLSAALLHDVVEDIKTSLDDIVSVPETSPSRILAPVLP
ncbi:hypothetical protein [Chryseobacterium sp. CFS15]|uniref:hypothetical protein n=1 Tax=Chryseobacterium sp. CFS15 TaxID=2986946 RepID=UPI0035BE284E